MTLIDLQGKALYSGDKEVKKAYLGGNVFYSLRQSIEPYAYKPTGMLYAYDFTQGLTEPYSTSDDVVSFKPRVFTSVTPVYTGTSMNLSAGSLKHDVTVSSVANTKSFYCSVTFDTVSARTDTIVYINTSGGGYFRIRKQVSGSNITFVARSQNGIGGDNIASPIITTPQTTLDFYIPSGGYTRFWVNGQPVANMGYVISMNGSNSDPFIYGAINIYDYKMYLNPGNTVFTDDIILEQYQNIQKRLQTI